MNALEEYLKNLNLSEGEIKIYLGLLKSGSLSISNLAESIEMNRITTHFNVKNLQKKGLVTNVRKGKENLISAENPSALTDLIEDEEKKLMNIKVQLPNIISIIENNIATNTLKSKFNVKHYQGLSGVRAIYKDVLNTKELYSYVNIKRIFELFPDNPQLFPESVKLHGLKMWEIIEDSEVSRKYVKQIDKKRYHYKFFPSAWDLSTFDYMIYEGKVAIVTANNNDINGILISSMELYENSLSIFKILWSLLPETQKLP